LYFQPFWFYRADRQTDTNTDRIAHTHRHTDADDRHISVGVSNNKYLERFFNVRGAAAWFIKNVKNVNKQYFSLL